MSAIFLGIALALGAALANACNQLFIRIGTDKGRAYDAVLIVILTNVVVLVPLVTAIYYPDFGLTQTSWISFIAAGLVGTMIGRIFFYTAIKRISASRSSPIMASHALVATILGVVVLGERLTVLHWAGVVAVVTGVAIISWETTRENPDDLPLRQLVIGLTFPFLAAVAFGIEPIFAKFGFDEGTPAPVGLMIKTIAAIIGFLLYLKWKDALPSVSTFGVTKSRWLVAAGISNTVFLLGYYSALSLAPVSVVMPFIITSPVFVVVLSALFMPRHLERITWQLVMGTVIVAVGVGVIVLYV